ncbi:hypothetical protein N8782_00510 [Methylophilaceae bacterium]|nr:hypothetical protein [Methylophilaceae bacterium]
MDNERKGLYSAIFAKLDEYSVSELCELTEALYQKELAKEGSSVRGIH